jgi:hypothetical protein
MLFCNQLPRLLAKENSARSRSRSGDLGTTLTCSESPKALGQPVNLASRQLHAFGIPLHFAHENVPESVFGLAVVAPPLFRVARHGASLPEGRDDRACDCRGKRKSGCQSAGSRTRTAWRQCRPSFVCGNRQDLDTCRPCAGCRRGIKGRKGIKGRNNFGAPLNRPRPVLQVSRAKLGMSWSPISLSPKGSFRTFCLLPGRFTRLCSGRRPCRDVWRLFTLKRSFGLSPHLADCRSARAAAVGPRHESFARCSFLEASRRSPQGDFPESADVCAFDGGWAPYTPRPRVPDKNLPIVFRI